MSLNLPQLERVPSDCCKWHNVACWYDACCGQCPELEQCRARWGVFRCVLPVSKHDETKLFDPRGHEWKDLRPPTLTWEGSD